ncbi:MAG: winged helix-turn-helix domain-containing protein [Planctomycetaceae bacterium]
MPRGRTSQSWPWTVSRWLETVRDDRVEALASRRHPGPRLKLSLAQRACLAEQLLAGAGARAHGFSTDLWTAPRVQRLLREQYGVEYHVNDIPALLRKLRFTPHQPETRARERHADEIAQGRECDWPRSKKSEPAGRRDRFLGRNGLFDAAHRAAHLGAARRHAEAVAPTQAPAAAIGMIRISP